MSEIKSSQLQSHLIRASLNSVELKNVPLEITARIDSTNDHLKRKLSLEPESFPYICIAEEQTQGRGTLTKNWYSPANKNIYLSLGFNFNNSPTALQGLSILVGISVLETLIAYGVNHPISLKWPNDILWQGKKLCGILIEIDSRKPNLTHAMIGIGLNVNMTEADSSHIGQPWISLQSILGAEQDRNKIIASLLDRLWIHLNQFTSQGLVPYLPRWAEYDFLKGKLITLQDSQGIHTGVVVGINHLGNLLLKDAESMVKSYTSGAISYSVVARE